MANIKITGIRFGIFGDKEKYSRIVIEGDNPFSKYQAETLTSPERIFVDIHNATLAIDREPVKVDDGLVERVRVGQNQPQVARVVLDLERGADYGIFTLAKDGNRPYRLVVDVLRQKETIVVPVSEIPQVKKLIAIDPGHGGSDPGAIGVNGIQEKDVVLAISLELGKLLSQNGFEVAFTRTKDETVSLAQRVKIIDALKPNLAVSVHCNSFWLPSANGIETFYHPNKPGGEKLAKQIQTELINSFNWTNRGVKQGNYYILRESRLQEIVLPEVGFLSNPTEGKAMDLKDNQVKVAEAIYKGISDFSLETK